jgi:hypothetical protein
MFLGLFLSSAAFGSSADISPLAVPKANPVSVIEGDEKIQAPVPKTFRGKNLRNPSTIRRFQEVKGQLQPL